MTLFEDFLKFRFLVKSSLHLFNLGFHVCFHLLLMSQTDSGTNGDGYQLVIWKCDSLLCLEKLTVYVDFGWTVCVQVLFLFAAVNGPLRILTVEKSLECHGL